MISAADPAAPLLRFRNSFAALPERFYSREFPVPVRKPRLVAVNHSLAGELGIDPERLDSGEFTDIFSGNRIPPGARPLSMAYAGHQFGNWVPRLGDGRAHLLGEAVDPAGQRRDIQLKGSGPTVFSRGGDGRAWIGPVLREYLVSEAMHALGIPTTRSLCAVLTGECVRRESALPGAVLTRVAKCHVRVGTFQYFYARHDTEALDLLLGYSVNRLHPRLRDAENPALEFLHAAVDGQAQLVAKWMNAGFVHGVMNTDNMSVACETIDFGPCAFLDEFRSDKVFSSIDHGGRYAFGRQPTAACWNLAQFANALLPLIHSDRDEAVKLAADAVNAFPDHYRSHWERGLCAKIGIRDPGDGDLDLSTRLLLILEGRQADFTLAFRLLSGCIGDQPAADKFFALFGNNEEIRKWTAEWQARLRSGKAALPDCAALMRTVNPAVIPRNHQIEKAIQSALRDDFAHFHRLFAAVQRPFEEDPDFREFQKPPLVSERVAVTFCGT